MSKQLNNLLDFEIQTLEKMLNLTEEQRKALVDYNSDKITSVSEELETTAKYLFELETERINFIASWLQLNKSDAQKITISEISNRINDNELKSSILNRKIIIAELITKINSINSLNRLLANRARRSIHEILSVISAGNNHVCNVKV